VFTEHNRLTYEPANLHTRKFTDRDTRLFVSNQHHQNFIDAVLTRGPTAAAPESSHRAATMCHLGAIAATLGRTVKFDPVAETFPGDAEANARLIKPLRGPWTLQA